MPAPGLDGAGPAHGVPWLLPRGEGSAIEVGGEEFDGLPDGGEEIGRRPSSGRSRTRWIGGRPAADQRARVQAGGTTSSTLPAIIKRRLPTRRWAYVRGSYGSVNALRSARVCPDSSPEGPIPPGFGHLPEDLGEVAAGEQEHGAGSGSDRRPPPPKRRSRRG